MTEDIIKMDWPLMANNITREDLDEVIEYLSQEDPRLTQSLNVELFEEEWSKWLGVKYSVFVNSGSSANLLSISALKEIGEIGEIIVPTITWVSDIASVLHCGYTPVFVDINQKTLGMNNEKIISKITPATKAVFLTHVLGFNALTEELIVELNKRNIPLIEDVCESHGATFKGKKLGTYGIMSNFSFYYAHHMSTIEGGMVSTNDYELYQILRMLRSHGMVRESTNQKLKESYYSGYPELNRDFIFAFPAYNVRSTELNAIIGRSQLKKLDENNFKRKENFDFFVKNLDKEKYFTDFAMDGSCNYAFTLILKNRDRKLCDRVVSLFEQIGVEYRRGTAGGGNQLRQPYLQRMNNADFSEFDKYPRTDHVHFFGFYIGNYPDLPHHYIHNLCQELNKL